MLLRHALALLASVFLGVSQAAQGQQLLNVSYDPTRELYKQFNQAFAAHWQKETGDRVEIRQSHGGSGKQARSVIDGLQADVVTLGLSADVDALNLQKRLIDPNWQSRLPDNSSPYTSTIVFLVRKGNPKQIEDWDDLARDDVEVITPNPKTSGGARWNFLAAWAYGRRHYGSEEKAREFVARMYRNAPVLDPGARAATVSFVQRGLGDVLLAWENEAYLALREQGGEQLQIVTPSLSILAEPSVALVDHYVDAHGTRRLAEAYLNYLYSDEGQRIAAQNFYRPRDAAIAERFKNQFKDLQLVTIDGEFGGWKKAQPRFFADDGLFDQIFEQINR